MLLLLPRLVLPIPQEAHPSRQHHKKQRTLRERLIMLYRGQWIDLVDKQLDDHTKAKELETDDDIKSCIRQMKAAASKGRLSKMWKQMMGFGLLPSSRRTAELVNEKWAPCSPDLPDHVPIPPDVLDKVFGVAPVSKAVSQLAAGAAADSLGWTHEMAQILHSQAGSFPSLERDP